MIIQPGLGALDGVAANLSQQTKDEARSAGILAADLPGRLRSFLHTAHKFIVHSVYFGERPVAIMAVATHRFPALEVELGPPMTFLITAEGFFEGSVAHRRQMRKHLAGLRDQFGPIYTETLSGHPNMKRWLKLLGYTPHPAAENLFRWG